MTDIDRFPHPDRRRLVQAGLMSLLPLGGCGQAPHRSHVAPAGRPLDDARLVDDLARRAFDYFWDTANPANGLVPDRWPTPSFASVAAVGFALSAYPIGVARGWASRAAARERTLATLRFFHQAPQGPEPRGRTGHRGFFYHFVDMAQGLRFERTELSTVDTALFLAGALHAQAFFDGSDAAEAEIRRLAQALYDRVDWRWAQTRPPSICLGWHPESGFIHADWKGYNESMLVYLLALGSRTHAVEPDAWEAWLSTYDRSWGQEYGQTYLRFAPLFGHQFTHAWVDFRGLADRYLHAQGLDYFENSRRATYAQQAYARANPEGWVGYGEHEWGITASDGPMDTQRMAAGRLRRFISYAGRGMGGAAAHDDGTLAPYGAGSSLPFAPEIVLPTLRAMNRRHGRHIVGRYGFFAFNRSFSFDDLRPQHGQVVPAFGWVDGDWLGIEVGPLLMMLANHQDGHVWGLMRGQAWLQQGLRRAGFRGGWLG